VASLRTRWVTLTKSRPDNMAGTCIRDFRYFRPHDRPSFSGANDGVLLGVGGFLALALTSIGLFGVISYIVSQRTHEIGVRRALGARQGDGLRLVVGHGFFLTVIGLAVGLGISF
jgi:ABC-type antimicrobial peptide transport system permease subunit